MLELGPLSNSKAIAVANLQFKICKFGTYEVSYPRVTFHGQLVKLRCRARFLDPILASPSDAVWVRMQGGQRAATDDGSWYYYRGWSGRGPPAVQLDLRCLAMHFPGNL